MQVSRVQKMLGDEFGTASNIKSRVNRQSVLGAITSAQQRLKLYNRVRLQIKRMPQVCSVLAPAREVGSCVLKQHHFERSWAASGLCQD